MEEFLKDLAGNYAAVLKKYFVYTGRAGRKEFWYFVLANIIIGFVLFILGRIPFLGWLFSLASWLITLAVFIPNIMVAIRRLHDVNKSGWYWLWMLLPLVGTIMVIVAWATKGMEAENQYGAVPADTKALKDWNELKELKDVFKQQKSNAPAPVPAGAAAETGKKKAGTSTKEKSVFCGECGAKNPKGTKFCGECGKAI